MRKRPRPQRQGPRASHRLRKLRLVNRRPHLRRRLRRAVPERCLLRPLRKQLDNTEAEMASVSQALQHVREQLGSAELYTEAQKTRLAELLKREGELKVRADELDELWLDQQQTLEELTG